MLTTFQIVMLNIFTWATIIHGFIIIITFAFNLKCHKTFFGSGLLVIVSAVLFAIASIVG